MIHVKRVKSGKIVHEDFRNSIDLIADGWQMHPSTDRFYIDLTDGTLNLLHGKFPAYLLRELPTNAVLEMRNTYNPIMSKDFGGFVAYITDSEKLELLEYYNEEIGTTLSYPYVRMVKKGDEYEGYGSENGKDWDIRGSIKFPNATLWGVELEGDEGKTLKIHTLSVYEDTKISFRALPKNARVEIYDIREEDPVLIAVLEDCGYEEDLSVFEYVMPLKIEVKVYDEEGNLTAQGVHDDVFGGDVFHCGNFLEVYYNGEPLDVHENDFGYIDSFYKDFRLELRNMSNIPHDNVNIAIQQYMNEFGWEWVEICEDVNGVPSGNFQKSLMISQVPASGSVFFWARITRSSVPVMVDDYLFDFVINVW